jgi:hypothetical protein
MLPSDQSTSRSSGVGLELRVVGWRNWRNSSVGISKSSSKLSEEVCSVLGMESLGILGINEARRLVALTVGISRVLSVSMLSGKLFEML